MADRRWTIYVPEHMHREIKIDAATEGQTIRDWVIECFEEKLRKNRESRKKEQ